jgi:hypothetical protein
MRDYPRYFESNSMNYPFRVFLSYSDEDSKTAHLAADALTCLELIPLWDKKIKPGTAFKEEI